MKIITDTGDYKIPIDNIRIVNSQQGTKVFIFRGGYKTLRQVYVCYCEDEKIEDIISSFQGYAVYGEITPEAPEDKKCKYVRITLIKGEEV